MNNAKPLTGRVGEDVRFFVDVEAFPDFESVQLIWYKNGDKIEKNDQHYNTGNKTDGRKPQAFLFISNIRLEDSGTYMLVSISHSKLNL